MKTVIPVMLSCLLLLGCSRKETPHGEAIVLSDTATMHVQKRVGSKLDGVHLDMKANGENWTFDAKDGEMTNGPDGMVHLILYDVQADLGSKGSVHKAHMSLAFRNVPPYKPEDSRPKKLPRFEFSAADLATPPQLGTNGVGSGHDTVVVHLSFSTKKAVEFAKFTREHMNQQTELVFGSNVVAESHVVAVIPNGRVDLSFSSAKRAQAVEALLRTE